MPDSASFPSESTIALLQARMQSRGGLAAPYYVRLQRHIQAMIDAGELAAGSGLPSERDLAKALNISRTTVKRSYDGLREVQSLVSSQGRGGTVVRAAPRVSPGMHRLKGFTEEMRELGLEPSTRVLECSVVDDRMVASIFGRSSQSLFLKLVRVRLANGAPMSREVAWYDLAVAAELADWDGMGSAYDCLRQRCGLVLAWADQSVEAVLSSAEENEVFGFSEPGPCLLLKRRAHTTDNRLVEYVEGTFRGDAYAYRLRLQA